MDIKQACQLLIKLYSINKKIITSVKCSKVSTIEPNFDFELKEDSNYTIQYFIKEENKKAIVEQILKEKSIFITSYNPRILSRNFKLSQKELNNIFNFLEYKDIFEKLISKLEKIFVFDPSKMPKKTPQNPFLYNESEQIQLIKEHDPNFNHLNTLIKYDIRNSKISFEDHNENLKKIFDNIFTNKGINETCNQYLQYARHDFLNDYYKKIDESNEINMNDISQFIRMFRSHEILKKNDKTYVYKKIRPVISNPYYEKFFKQLEQLTETFQIDKQDYNFPTNKSFIQLTNTHNSFEIFVKNLNLFIDKMECFKKICEGLIQNKDRIDIGLKNPQKYFYTNKVGQVKKNDIFFLRDIYFKILINKGVEKNLYPKDKNKYFIVEAKELKDVDIQMDTTQELEIINPLVAAENIQSQNPTKTSKKPNTEKLMKDKSDNKKKETKNVNNKEILKLFGYILLTVVVILLLSFLYYRLC